MLSYFSLFTFYRKKKRSLVWRDLLCLYNAIQVVQNLDVWLDMIVAGWEPFLMLIVMKIYSSRTRTHKNAPHSPCWFNYYLADIKPQRLKP